MKFLKDLIQFVRSVAEDVRIPDRDKKVLLGLLALIISPFDIIPDWIPIIGLLDDVILMAVVLDYLFNVLDQAILLSHSPWGMKSFVSVRKAAQVIAFLTPRFIKERIWKYEPSIYGGR